MAFSDKFVLLERSANLLMVAWYPWVACFQRMWLHSKATASTAPGSEHRAAVGKVQRIEVTGRTLIMDQRNLGGLVIG